MQKTYIEMGSEVDNREKILKGTGKYFVVDSNNIGTFEVGGIDGHIAYSIRYPRIPDPYDYYTKREPSYKVVLELKEDDTGYYFTTLEGKERILLSKEDCLGLSDRRMDAFLIPGEYWSSRDRERTSLKQPHRLYELFADIDSSYFVDNFDTIRQNPLTVNLSCLRPLKEEEDSDWIFDANKRYQDAINRLLESRSIEGQNWLMERYNVVKDELPRPKEKGKENGTN